MKGKGGREKEGQAIFRTRTSWVGKKNRGTPLQQWCQIKGWGKAHKGKLALDIPEEEAKWFVIKKKKNVFSSGNRGKRKCHLFKKSGS